jgi:hypothetical protein
MACWMSMAVLVLRSFEKYGTLTSSSHLPALNVIIGVIDILIGVLSCRSMIWKVYEKAQYLRAASHLKVARRQRTAKLELTKLVYIGHRH